MIPIAPDLASVRFHERWLREWPLGLAVATLVLALVGKGPPLR